MDNQNRLNFDDLEPISTVYGFIGVAVSILFFIIFHKIVQRIWTIDSNDKRTLWKWKNLSISWLHALLISIWNLSIYVIYPDVFIDMVAYHNTYIYLMVAFSTGYFLVDFADHYIHGYVLTDWEVLLHHVGVLSIFIYNLAASRYLPYTGVALLVEVNSIFLHARKLQQMAKVPFTSPMYRVNKWLNLATFVVFRFGALVLITHGMWLYPHRFSTIYRNLLATTMLSMYIINSVLFWRLVRSDILRGEKNVSATVKKHQSAHDANMNFCNNNGFKHD